MQRLDPYAVLGVKKTASQEEIKSAYRKKALKHHPDRNPGDESAEELFKSVSTAYSMIGDEESRRKYDDSRRYSRSKRPGAGFRNRTANVNVNFAGGGPGSSGTWEDLFGSFQQHRRPMVVRARVDITLEELSSGVQRSFVMDGNSVNFVVPPHARDGMTVVVPIASDQELHVVVHVIAHQQFRVHGDDLLCTIAVPLKTAIIGGSYDLQTLSGRVKLRIEELTSSHKKLRLKDYGLHRQDGTRGSIICEIKLDADSLTLEEREKMINAIS